MRHKILILLSLVMMAGLLLTGSPVKAQSSASQVGTVSIELSAIGAGVGFSWGRGVLRFQGRQYPIKVTGLSVGDVGISSVSAVGNVYNLQKVSDFPGTYAAVGAGISVAGGVGGSTMRNQKGVIIDLYTVQQGVQLNIGPQGFTIEMR